MKWSKSFQASKCIIFVISENIVTEPSNVPPHLAVIKFMQERHYISVRSSSHRAILLIFLFSLTVTLENWFLYDASTFGEHEFYLFTYLMTSVGEEKRNFQVFYTFQWAAKQWKLHKSVIVHDTMNGKWNYGNFIIWLFGGFFSAVYYCFAFNVCSNMTLACDCLVLSSKKKKKLSTMKQLMDCFDNNLKSFTDVFFLLIVAESSCLRKIY